MEETNKTTEEVNENKEINEPKEVNFLDGVEEKGFNINAEIDELATPKQNYSDDLEGDPENDIESDLDGFMDEKPKSNTTAKKNASLIVRWFDNAFAFLLGWWSGDGDFTTYKAEKYSLSILEESIEKGLIQSGKDFEMPWWYGLFIEVPIAYAGKIKLAFKKRKENKQKALLKKKAESNYKKDNPGTKRTPSQQQEFQQMKESRNSTLVDHNHPNRICKVCQTPLTKNQSNFCSRKCSAADLNARKKAKANGGKES